MLDHTDRIPDSPVVAALDLGNRSAECLRYAWGVAARTRRPLLILHVAHEDVRTAGMYRRYNRRNFTMPILEIAREMLADFVATFAREHPGFDGIEQVQLVVTGVPGPRIAEIADLSQAEAIICAREKQAGPIRRLYRSIFGEAKQHARCPVLEVGPV